jgi:UDP-3-O-[3-hydroxymyristoyl] glucosamine N-acyltransferase
MSQPNPHTNINDLAALVGGRLSGEVPEIPIIGVASLTVARQGEIAFLEDLRLAESALLSAASCLIVPENSGIRDRCIIEVARPKLAFALIAKHLYPPKKFPAGVHATAIVDASVHVDASAYIGPYACIGERSQVGANSTIHAGVCVGDDVIVGRDCVLHPRVVLYDNVQIGDRVILHAGVVVGADGFGYVRGADSYHKFPQIGTVLIADDVEIGAHTCIDRGALGETRIGRGTKIDNLVQIAHNVEIGERVVIAAQTGISGSTIIEDDAVIGGQVGMGDHARVQRGAVVGSKAGILPGKIVRRGTVVWGVPVRPLEEYKRLNAHFGRLPQMRADLDELKKQVQELMRSAKKELNATE